ncbi:MAG: hypothetical protein LUE10_05745, partial [Alistipes sp.]|nr:hypothetical protein [Alistipes sp.]
RIIEQQLDSDPQTLIRLGRRLIINEKYIYYINISKQHITLADISFPTKFTLKVSKQALWTLKATLQESVGQHAAAKKQNKSRHPQKKL